MSYEGVSILNPPSIARKVTGYSPMVKLSRHVSAPKLFQQRELEAHLSRLFGFKEVTAYGN